MAGGFKKFLSVIGFGEEEDEELLAEEPERVPVATPRQERRATAASSDYTPGSLASQRKVSPRPTASMPFLKIPRGWTPCA